MAGPEEPLNNNVPPKAATAVHESEEEYIMKLIAYVEEYIGYLKQFVSDGEYLSAKFVASSMLQALTDIATIINRKLQQPT